MDIERKFEDLGVDAITGTRLMGLLRLTPDDFLDPSRFMRFKDVIDHFKNVPDIDYIVNKVTAGKSVDRLDHLWGYAQLSQQRSSLKKEVEDVRSKLDIYQDVGDEFQKNMANGLNQRILDIKSEAKKVDEQIQQYEY